MAQTFGFQVHLVHVFALSFSNNFAQRQKIVRVCVCYVYVSLVSVGVCVFVRMTIKTNNDINLIMPLCH